jgi:RNA polymerase sigma-70 factor (ECF subfamily)
MALDDPVHSRDVWTAEVSLKQAPAADLAADVRAIYEEHGDFVWRSLARLGVRAADLRDMAQEVFVVVHRRLGERDGTSAMTTWLFGICLRVASAYRRRAFRRYEDLVEHLPDAPAHDAVDPEEEATTRQARARLAQILDELDLEQRAVFVMFEVDEVPCHEIAAMLGCPLGTVYSRLRAARKAFETALKRVQARDAWGGTR